MSGSPVVDVRTSFGAAFIGLLVSTTLFGLMVAQGWIYYWHYWNKDRKLLKFFVGFLIVMEAFHTFLCAYVIYWYLVLNFGNIENLEYNVWAMSLQPNISAIPGSAVQLYYARRIYIIGKSIFFPMVIVLILVLGNAIGLYFAAKNFASPRFASNFLLTCIGMGGAVLMDIMVAGVMCWYLYRKKTGFARTDSIIMTLMAYTINSGLLTSLLGIAMTISFLVAPSSMIQVAFFWIMGRCYVNSLLAMLNSRDYVRERSSANNTDNSFNLTSIQIAPPSEAYGSKSTRTGVSVTVHRSTAPDFASRKSDRNVGLTFEVSKPKDTNTIPSQGQSRTSESSA